MTPYRSPPDEARGASEHRLTHYAGPSSSIARHGGRALLCVLALALAWIVSATAPWFVTVAVAVVGLALALRLSTPPKPVAILRVRGATLTLRRRSGEEVTCGLLDLDSVVLDAKTQFR